MPAGPAKTVRYAEETRPAPRAGLPFRFLKGQGNSPDLLEYEEEVSTPVGVKRLTFRLGAGREAYSAVMRLMSMYRDLEADRDGVAAERDQLRTRLAEAEGEMRRMDLQLREAERRRKT